MKNLKNNKGITLIALVITIIVLIILAGVSINLVLGDNGIITKAKESKAKTEQSQVKEDIQLKLADLQAEKIITGGSITSSELETIITNSKGIAEKDASGKITGIKVGDTVIPIEEVTNGITIREATAPSTTLAEVTNANIGEYIDLGNNVVGETATTDDWRILYVEGNTVYAMLADYLPNSTNLARGAGLDTSSTYSVFSNTNRDTLLNGLTSTTAWSTLANGISGATVTGTPTAELLINSYNAKHGTSLDYTSGPTLDTTDNLYVPHDTDIDGCYGYWLASPSADAASFVWDVGCDGLVGDYGFSDDFCGVRPVVSLPSNIPVTQENGVWVVQH